MKLDNPEERIAAIIPLEFWSDPVDTKDGETKLCDFVKWQKIGNPNHCGEDRITRIEKFQPEVFAALKPYYEAWKKNEEIDVVGTRIENWPAITRKMAELLKTNGFRSVEAFAESTESDLSRIGMGARTLRNKAVAFVQLSGSASNASGQVALLQEENRILKDRLSDLEAFVKSIKETQKEQAPSVQSVEVQEPKKRGRPPKEVL